MRRLLTLLPLMVLLAIVPAVRAQADERHFPGAMPASEIAALLVTLRASPDQQDALLRQHEIYLSRFEDLRAELLEDAVQRMGIFGQPVMPEPGDARRALGMVETGRARIAALDDDFFREISMFLAPAQQQLLDRVRRQRERQRHLAVLRHAPLPAISAVDLRHTLSRCGITAHDHAHPEIHALLLIYEDRLTSDLASLSRATARMLPDAILALDRAGVAPGTNFSSEELMAELAPIIEAAIGDSTRQQTRTIAAMDRMMRATLRDISETLGALPEVGPESLPGRLVAARFRRAALGERHFEVGMYVFRHNQYEDLAFHAEAWARTLEPPLRDRLSAVITEHAAHLDRIGAQMADACEALVEHWKPISDDDGPYALHRERVDELSRMAQTHRAAILRAMQQEAGADWAHALDRRVLRPADPLDVHDPDDPARDPEEWSWTGDWALPSPMGARDERRIRALLDLDHAQVDALHTLLESYRAALNDLPETQRVRTLAQQRAGRDFVTPDEAEIRARQLRSERRRAVDAMNRLESGVFDELSALLPGVAPGTPRGRLLELLRICREAELFARRGMVWFVARASGDSQLRFQHPLDLLVRERSLSPEERRTAALAAEDSIKQMPATAQRMFDHALHVHSIADGWEPDQPYAITRSSDRFQRAARPAAVMYQADLELEAMLESAVDAMTSVLPVSAANAITGRFRRAQWPEIYDRIPNVIGFIERARDLQDLTPAQRVDLDEMLLEVRDELERSGIDARDQMNTLVRLQIRGLAAPENKTASEEEDSTANDLRRSIDRLLRERREFALRSLLRLQSTLTEAQTRRIGPLPTLGDLAR